MRLPLNTIVVGDALTELRKFPTGTVDTIVTSPPYFRLRDYNVDRQLGLESTVDEWVAALRFVLREGARVLRPTGSLWLNLGDSYSTHQSLGAPPKAQLLGPERLLLALTRDGWIVRNKVVWSKPNAMPTSVVDRLNTTHEYLYFCVRQRSYYFDLDQIRVPHRTHRVSLARSVPDLSKVIGPLAAKRDGLSRPRADGIPGHARGKNPGDCWTIATHSFRGAHFATFPEALIERPILATCPPGGVVLDPFIGSGTVALVADRLGRNWVGIELNPEYAALARRRIEARQGVPPPAQEYAA